MEKLVSRKEVALHFGVTSDTVHNWQKKGIIVADCIINGRPRYNLAEVIKSLTTKAGGKQCNK